MTQRLVLVGVAVAALGLGGFFALAPAQEATPPNTTPPEEPEFALPTPDVPEPSGRDDMQAGRSLLERGAELFLRGLMEEVGPGLDEMQKGLGEAAAELGPRLREVLALVDDMRNYDGPERLPNGDIILRRLPGAPPPPPLLPPPLLPPDDGAKPAPGDDPVTDL